MPCVQQQLLILLVLQLQLQLRTTSLQAKTNTTTHITTTHIGQFSKVLFDTNRASLLLPGPTQDSGYLHHTCLHPSDSPTLSLSRTLSHSPITALLPRSLRSPLLAKAQPET